MEVSRYLKRAIFEETARVVSVFTIFPFIGRNLATMDVGLEGARLLIYRSIDLSLSAHFIAGRTPRRRRTNKARQRRLRRSSYRSRS